MEWVDIFSKAEVVQHLKDLAAAGRVRECVHLQVRKGHVGAFYPSCTVDWAKPVPAANVVLDDDAESAPSSYDWPECPAGCPKYLESPNFETTLTECHSEFPLAPPGAYVDPDRIAQLKGCKSVNFDLTKLIALCEELNACNRISLVFAVGMLVRAILDHVPPIFGYRTFPEVARSYSGGKSFKDAMDQLENTSRKIADSFLHAQIRKSEMLPKPTQVDFRPSLDMLLQEVLRLLK